MYYMMTTVRLDAETSRALERAAREMGRTRSDVIREAIVELARRRLGPKPAGPYGQLRDLIGVARGGPPDLSVRSGETFRRLLEARRTRRR